MSYVYWTCSNVLCSKAAGKKNISSPEIQNGSTLGNATQRSSVPGCILQMHWVSSMVSVTFLTQTDHQYENPDLLHMFEGRQDRKSRQAFRRHQLWAASSLRERGLLILWVGNRWKKPLEKGEHVLAIFLLWKCSIDFTTLMY